MVISIITPSYNQGQFIERTIQSVLSQAIPMLEYIIIDAASTDNTLAVLKRYDNLQQLRWISEQDNGQAHAINKGLNATTGDIIGWINSDDIYYPNSLKRVIDFFATHPDTDIVYGDAYHIDANDQIIERYYTEKWNTERLKEVCYLCQPAVFFRRKIITQCGMLDENLQYCMDYEYWLRLAKSGIRFAYLNHVLSGSRLHSDTKTLGSRLQVHKEINNMLKQTIQYVPNSWLKNYAHIIEENKKYPNLPTWRTKKRTLAIESIRASFHWNKKINILFLFTNLKLIIHSLIGTLRKNPS